MLHDQFRGKKKVHRRNRILILSVLALLVLAAALILTITLCRDSAVPKGREIMQESGMFEWDEDSILHVDQALELADRMGITRWYQEIDFSNLDKQELSAFIEAMAGMKVEVYALAGAKEWGLEEDGASLIAYMEDVQEYNEEVNQEQRIKGIMADVEPYVLKEWKEDRQTHMEAYASGMIKCREWAEDHSLILIACIPRHYDDQGLSVQLEKLIAQGCHEVAVMDYDCGNEVEKIETEALLAVQYEKPLHCILEFQEVGKHGLTEEKTYRNKGLEAAQEAWNQVEKAFEDARLIRDYHWTAPIWDMLEQEEDEDSE